MATRARVLRNPRVLVVSTPPDARLVAPFGGAVKPLVHAPETVKSARIGRISVVDNAVFEQESAHARPLADVGRRIDSASGRHLDSPLIATLRILTPLPGLPPLKGAVGILRRLDPVVVFSASFALLFFGDLDTEIQVEVAAYRGCPRKGPPHPSFVGV